MTLMEEVLPGGRSTWAEEMEREHPELPSAPTQVLKGGSDLNPNPIAYLDRIVE